MDEAFEVIDSEREFLAEILNIAGDRVIRLKSQIVRSDPDSFIVYEPMEYAAGVAMVAAQRYISSVCKWIGASIPLGAQEFKEFRKNALALDPKRQNVPVARVVDAAANYWKHIEDGEGAVWENTRLVLRQVGVAVEEGWCVINTLDRCGYRFSPPRDHARENRFLRETGCELWSC